MQIARMPRAYDANRNILGDAIHVRPVVETDILMLAEWMDLEAVQSLKIYLEATTPFEGNTKLIALSNGFLLAFVELHLPEIGALHLKYKSVTNKLLFNVFINPECFKNRAGCALIIELFVSYIREKITYKPLLWEIHDSETLLKWLATRCRFQHVRLKTELLYTLYQYS